MAKRFRSLKRALKTLLPVGAEADAVPSAPPAGTVLAYFATRESRNIEYPSDADRSRKLDVVGVHPFAVTHSATAVWRVPISSNSVRDIGTYVGTLGDLLLTANPPKTANLNRLFKPAKVTIFIPAIATEQPTGKVQSKITGFKYKKRAGNSRTYPFGRDATEIANFTAAKNALIDKILAKAPSSTVSFKPEDARYI